LGQTLYGISQYPNTEDYIIVYNDIYCEKCGEKYTIIRDKWCKLCQINYIKSEFPNSGDKKIDDFIQEMRLKINNRKDTIIEWIPFNQFINIKKKGKDDDDNAIIYFAKWKDGPLKYDNDKNIYTKSNYKQVTLKCLNNSKNRIDEFLNEVLKLFISLD
jgi:hypothetical protein